VGGIWVAADGDGAQDGRAVRFVAGAGGRELAGCELFPSSYLGDETGRLITFWWADGQAAAARAVIDAAVQAAGPEAELHLAANAETDDRISERLELFALAGFSLWQEKEGFWWADAGQDLPLAQDVVVRTLAETGRARYEEVVQACTDGTLDRIDADAIASMGAEDWSAALISDAARPEEEDIWFVIENRGGDPVGYVAVGGFAERTGTIMHIGVAAGHRGHGYVDQLLRVANRAARSRGWTGMLSDVDTGNQPMIAAMIRGGHLPGARPWHRWVYRRGGAAPGRGKAGPREAGLPS
jgi:ribosomal protein S18 acetylase RimI-like enzyme